MIYSLDVTEELRHEGCHCWKLQDNRDTPRSNFGSSIPMLNCYCLQVTAVIQDTVLRNVISQDSLESAARNSYTQKKRFARCAEQKFVYKYIQLEQAHHIKILQTCDLQFCHHCAICNTCRLCTTPSKDVLLHLDSRSDPPLSLVQDNVCWCSARRVVRALLKENKYILYNWSNFRRKRLCFTVAAY